MYCFTAGGETVFRTCSSDRKKLPHFIVEPTDYQRTRHVVSSMKRRETFTSNKTKPWCPRNPKFGVSSLGVLSPPFAPHSVCNDHTLIQQSRHPSLAPPSRILQGQSQPLCSCVQVNSFSLFSATQPGRPCSNAYVAKKAKSPAIGNRKSTLC